MRIGIDLGGTKTEIAVLDPAGGVIYRQRLSTPRNDYQGIIQTICQLVAAAEHQLGPLGKVGIGIPGALKKDGTIKNANTTILIGKPFTQDLEKELQRPVRLANDANCFTLSEATDGAASPYKVVFGVIIGTGCGGGIVVDKKIIHGVNGIAGEWGHNPLPTPLDEERPGPLCYCGRRGCIETFISGTGFEHDYQQNTSQSLCGIDIVAKAASGDHESEAALARLEERLARSLATVINLIDPDCIVLGGGLSNIRRLYDNLPELWRPYVFSDSIETKLLPAKYGDSSGVRGAAWLWE